MPIQTLDHINIRTANLEPMIAWYQDILGLTLGPRPNFSFGGAWLYAGDVAIVHLVQVPLQPGIAGDLQLEHFALSATDKEGFLAKLEASGVPSRVNTLSDFGITQVNIHDPDGNHIHVDFRE
jgi:catechol 2,3-dioxygenase-like lactoylglutathione lyase family enzyme